MSDHLDSEGSGTYPKSDFRVQCISLKLDLRQVEQGFSSFFFAKFEDFSKWSVPKALQKFDKCQKLKKSFNLP